MPAATDDPAYQAYLRALGFDEGIARKDAARQRTEVTAGAQLAKPELLAQGGERREGISDSFEDRGMFLGSERLRDLADQRRGEQYALAMIDKGQADALAGINMGLERELAGVNKQRINAQQQHDVWAQAKAASEAEASFDPVARQVELIGYGRETQQPGLRQPTLQRPSWRPSSRSGWGR